MGPALFAIIAGGLMKSKGVQMEAEDRAQSLEEEAQAAETNAFMAREAGRYNAERIRINSQKIEGSIQADYAASGISDDSVSALEVLRESHTSAELDRQSVLFGADVRYNDLMRRAGSARRGAGNAREAGRTAAVTSLFSTGADAYDKTGGGK